MTTTYIIKGFMVVGLFVYAMHMARSCEDPRLRRRRTNIVSVLALVFMAANWAEELGWAGG